MAKIVYLLFLFFLSYPAFAVQLPSRFQSMQVYYKFDEGDGGAAYDALKSTHILILQGGVSYFSTRYGYGVSFDGVNDFGSVVGTNKFWNINGFSLVMAVRFPLNPAGSARICRAETSGTKGYQLECLPDAPGTKVRFDMQNADVGDTSTLLPGKWYFLTFIFTGTRARIYVNATFVTEFAVTAPVEVGNATFVFGASTTVPNNPILADFDFFAYIDRPITRGEVSYLYRIYRGSQNHSGH